MSGNDRLKHATEWFVEWEAAGEIPLSREQLQAWREWAEDPGNLAAFDRIVRLREDARGIGLAALSTVQEMGRTRVRSRRWMAFAAAAGIATLAAAFLFDSIQTPRYSTGRAEQRILRMSDGSTVTLGGQTTLTMEYSAHERKAVLHSGEALFNVAQEAARPFTVVAGKGSIRALGTAFVVKRDSDRVVVTVTDGRVEVASRQLTRGEQLSYNKSGQIIAVKSTDPRAAAAWSRGYLVFDHEPLRYVIQAVNRYSTRQIVLDRTVEDFLYTGTVFQDQTNEWIRGLERIFPVTIVSDDPEEISVRMRVAPKSACHLFPRQSSIGQQIRGVI